MIRATAPGKLMLLGEYAVLEGAPAIVAAVDRRVEVVLAETDELLPHPLLRIETDLPGEEPVELDISRGTPGLALSEGARFTRDVVGAVLGEDDEAGRLATLRRIEVRSAALRAGAEGAKLGLGSSAAVAAALAAAVLAWTADGEPPAAEVLVERARAAHRAAVGGSGSGVDVAASVLGGIHAFRLTPTGLDHEAIALPEGIVAVPVWTGAPADTSAFIGRLHEFAKASPEAYRDAMDRLGAIAEEGVQACRDDDVAGFLGAAEEYEHGMQALGQGAGMPIVSEALEKVAALAASVGAVAKPSGAGGGDIAVVFGTSGMKDQLLARFEGAGLPPVRAAITSAGADVATETRLPS